MKNIEDYKSNELKFDGNGNIVYLLDEEVEFFKEFDKDNNLIAYKDNDGNDVSYTKNSDGFEFWKVKLNKKYSFADIGIIFNK